MKSMKPVIFKLNGENYGIDISCVNSIEEAQKISVIQNASKHIRGILNLRGEAIPVISLRSKFGYAENASDQSRLIITGMSGMQIAVEVDEVTGIKDVEGEDILEAPSIVINRSNEYISRIVKMEQNIVIILDMDKLVTPEEQEEIKDMIESL
ncbi:chemotaxis protein CheW [Anaerobium acetethylicum]|uniref:Purine-binding chemotaxis protein CheW n=1 Tax=Anaerobium acetethylicum TaxID=1619234 RepID=A0A1D3TXD8_9FIRM|nr:chemotaxis protein CheW [Anaerobium acetethylicum]SCP98995.1 purine-binding chemotaxis protein CheW [Anaerobium acetethylicum]